MSSIHSPSPSLTAMIYASAIELRLDQEDEKKTVILCSLGLNPISNTSLCADHDTDIRLDVRISNEDLLRLNADRKQMNLTLYSGESSGNKDLVPSVHRIVCSELQRLIYLCCLLDRCSFFFHKITH
ncbi:hypothetical protein I4U23_018172 [Adineta vaga]|nr:hypothetical protein I4U23_018172 [Adineta vaga]